jgi:hypothetical protein
MHGDLMHPSFLMRPTLGAIKSCRHAEALGPGFFPRNYPTLMRVTGIPVMTRPSLLKRHVGAASMLYRLEEIVDGMSISVLGLVVQA